MDEADRTRVFKEAYDKFHNEIAKSCFFQCHGQSALAKDITQDTFTNFWVALGRYDKVDQPRALLYKIMRNLVIDSFRAPKQASIDEMEEEYVQFGSLKDVEKADDVIEAQRIIDFLRTAPNSLFKSSLWLSGVKDMTIQEVAQFLGVTENNVSVRLHRGRKWIRQLIKSQKQ